MTKKKTPKKKKPVRQAKPIKSVKQTKAEAASAPKISISGLKRMNLPQLVATLAAYLEQMDCDPVLTGHACAAIHCKSNAMPSSIDLAISSYALEEIEEAMKGIGFKSAGLRVFTSSELPFDITLVPPPLAVGDAIVDDIRRMKTAKGNFKMLNPTDTVRQRLSAYYRWGERAAFDDAVRVAKKHKIDMELVKRWSQWEWCEDKFDEFCKAVQS